MSYTFELNNERKDANFVSGKINGKSAIVEIFSAMRDGKDGCGTLHEKAG